MKTTFCSWRRTCHSFLACTVSEEICQVILIFAPLKGKVSLESLPLKGCLYYCLIKMHLAFVFLNFLPFHPYSRDIFWKCEFTGFIKFHGGGGGVSGIIYLIFFPFHSLCNSNYMHILLSEVFSQSTGSCSLC